MKPFEEPILVTRPYLPPLELYKAGLDEIWHNQWLTNNGPVLQRFTRRLASHFALPEANLSLLLNGTLALEFAFHVMNLGGSEVITTPFTFVATAHALKTTGAIPVFADIDPETLCLCPRAAEALITPKTKAIVPVHVYGHPCDVDGFARLARKHNLTIIYDSAHAFGVKIDGASIAAHGDANIFSFHATKLFHSIEGGLLIFNDPGFRRETDALKNFAISSETECAGVGTNAKMNEMQALMGLCCLDVLPQLIARRKAIYETYRERLGSLGGIEVIEKSPILHGHPVEHNYAYIPVLFDTFELRERVYEKLKSYNVFTRRYFYPLLTTFSPYRASRGTRLFAHEFAERVLTLPVYHELPIESVETICEMIRLIIREGA